MEREEREIIDRYCGQICEDAIPVDMLPYLPCLTQNDKEKIKCEETNSGPRQATVKLLWHLRRRAGAFQEFVVALRLSGCGHLADLLDPREQEGTEDIIHNELNPHDLPDRRDGIILFHDQGGKRRSQRLKGSPRSLKWNQPNNFREILMIEALNKVQRMDPGKFALVVKVIQRKRYQECHLKRGTSVSFSA